MYRPQKKSKHSSSSVTSTLRVIPDSDDDNPTSDTHELVKTTARHVVVDASASGRPHRGKSLRFTEDSELRLTQLVREHSGFVDVAPAFGEWLDSSPQDCATDLLVVGDTQLEVHEPQGDDESDHDSTGGDDVANIIDVQDFVDGEHSKRVRDIQRFRINLRLKLVQTKTLLEWIPLRDTLLAELIWHDGVRAQAECSDCYRAMDRPMRCKDCFGNIYLCVECTRKKHSMFPFHRVDVSHQSLCLTRFLFNYLVGLDRQNMGKGVS